MALNLDYFRAIQNSIGSPSDSETRRRLTAARVGKDYFRSLDVDKFLLWNEYVTDHEYFLNVYDRKFSSVIGQEQNFTCPMEVDVDTGDILFNPIDQEYWIVMMCAPVDRIYRKGLMYLCNIFLKWEDKEGNLWEYPAHDINTTQYNSGIFQGRMVDYVTSQHRLTTTADKNVRALKIDTRFFLGYNTSVPEVFKLTQNDTSSLHWGKGLAALTVLRSTYNPETDDINTGICRTKEEVNEIPDDTPGDFTVSYPGQPLIIIGNKKLITCSADVDTWEIVEEELRDLIDIDILSATQAKVHIPITDDILPLAGHTFTLSCRDVNGNTVEQSFLISGGV